MQTCASPSRWKKSKCPALPNLCFGHPQPKQAHLPGEALAVHVDQEVGGVKVQNGRLLVLKQPPEGPGQAVRARGGQHAHELVEGTEGLAQLKLDVQVGDAGDVTRKGGVVVGVVPVGGRGQCNDKLNPC